MAKRGRKPGQHGCIGPYHRLQYCEMVDFRKRALPITADFAPPKEAKPFVHMYRTGQMSVEQVQETLIMTDQQRQLLEAEMPKCEHGILRKLQYKRWKTWLAFQAMIAKPSAVVQ